VAGRGPRKNRSDFGGFLQEFSDMLVYLLLRTTRHKTQLVVSEILSPGANSNI